MSAEQKLENRSVPVDPLRSRIMRANKPRGCRSTEVRLRMALIRGKIRGWVMHATSLPGTPDFWFPRQRVAVFVDGDFWHGNPRRFRLSKTRTEFWNQKIEANRARDRRVNRLIRDLGVRIVRIWESEIKTDDQLAGKVDAITRLL
jgi:DNA mismatch endonuclease (patch repair protein)